jgi:DNA gyrase subunit A
MNLSGGSETNEVIGMIAVDSSELLTRQVLVVSEKGYGKRSAMLVPRSRKAEGEGSEPEEKSKEEQILNSEGEEMEFAYRMVNRGGKGVKTLQVTDKTGNLIAIKDVKDDDQLMIINRSGMTIRMGLDEMRVLGRATQGVRLIELRKNDQIAAVAKVDGALKEDDVVEDGTTEGGDGPAPDANGTEVDNVTNEE